MIKDKLYSIKQKVKRFFKGIRLKPYYKTANKFWVQKMPLKIIDNRFNFFVSECENKDVLHFGCTDWPNLGYSD